MPEALARVKVCVRWSLHRDLPDMADIDEINGVELPWPAPLFEAHFRDRNTIGKSAEVHDQVVGFAVYNLGRSHIELLRLGVAPYVRRRGIAAQLVEDLKRKLGTRRPVLAATVRESNLPMQLFLRSQGFRAVGVFRRFFPDTEESGYRFRFELTEAG